MADTVFNMYPKLFIDLLTIHVHNRPELNTNLFRKLIMSENIFQIQIAEYRNDEEKQLLDHFRKEVINRTAEPPWNEDYALRTNKPVVLSNLYAHSLRKKHIFQRSL